jgi:hypothetical protein
MFHSNSPSELSSDDALSAVDSDPFTCLVTNLPAREYLLHRCPVSLDPAAVVTTVSMGWNSDLREFELRPAAYLRYVKDGDRVVIGPPARGAPGLNDSFPRP